MRSPSSSSLSISPPLENKSVQNNHNNNSSVTCMYRAFIAGFWRNVTVFWNKNLMNYSLSISIEGCRDSTCRIDVKSWQFWAKKGYKTFEVDGKQVEAYWDLRSAKFSGSSQPLSDYYVALISDEEVVLLLGDKRKKAYKRSKSRPALSDPIMLSKTEHAFGKRSFSTRASFDNRREQEIVVESSVSGSKEPEMWISIDGIVVIHVRNLQWKFRGNQTVVIGKQEAVQVYWDVHAWLFSGNGGYGLFLFKAGVAEEEEEGSDCRLFLYAWKIE
ncbi:hypothetical protein M569_04363 [Genlisea aurea]|uniref:DUF868 domain-containing protein n=1 Tax=Genlisea aurea TaxID=192259 RepID=S8CT17_9LAMI|nr:hypothetical protein M569_04363 [Genlisea aurea]